jgi:hypothetical protein
MCQISQMDIEIIGEIGTLLQHEKEINSLIRALIHYQHQSNKKEQYFY